MRVRLNGLSHFTKRLATGEVVTYWYAWRGGPRLSGELGGPEFIASYNGRGGAAALRSREPGVLLAVLRKFEGSQDFRQLAARTQEDYRGKIKIIEAEFGDLPLAALSDPRMRGKFREWRDRLAERSSRQADYALAVLALILGWALDNGLVDANPCTRMGRLYGSNRADKIWTEEDEKNFNARAPAHMHLPLLTALWTGQRQGDLLALNW